jgi:hypothetical protein
MAEAFTIRHGDTLTKILDEKRGLKAHEIYPWIQKMKKMNPHISDLNRIFPGESILIPESLNENVVRARIWQNAFSKIPEVLTHPYRGSTLVYIVHPSDTIDSVAQYMFSSGPYQTMLASNKRALLIHNNPFLENHLENGRLPEKMLLNISPAKLSEFDINHWQIEQSPLKSYLEQMQEDTRTMFEQPGAEEASTVARVVEYLKSIGASVGMDDVVGGMAGVTSGYAGAGSMTLANINALGRELYSEALEKLGPKVVHSGSANHIARMQEFLTGHPKYTRLMRHFQELPRRLLPKVLFPKGATLTPTKTSSHVAAARHFRKHFALPLKKWNNSTRYLNTVAKQLNGRLGLLKGVGRHATWYIPATFGVISVATAPRELRMRRLFEEGFGILGGAAGTVVGSTVIAPGALGLMAICGLCLGPFGAFVVVFICASIGGIALSWLGEEFGSKFYERSNLDAIYDVQSSNGRIYYSPEQFLENSQPLGGI